MLHQQAWSTKKGCMCRVGEPRVRFTCSRRVEKWRSMLVKGRGRRQRRSQRREGEASPPSFERFSIIIQHALLPLDEVRRIYGLRLCRRPLFLHIGFHHTWHLGRCRTVILHAYRFSNCFDYCLSGNLVCTADLEAVVINFHCL